VRSVRSDSGGFGEALPFPLTTADGRVLIAVQKQGEWFVADVAFINCGNVALW
jgi:cytochrome oxidase Cu insertion factor (SCO1/SenC/PrrC family)